MVPLSDRIGQVFGRLTILDVKRARSGAQTQPFALVRCSCGAAPLWVRVCNLLTGGTRSCGCLHREQTKAAVTTHGKSKTVEYRIWAGMKDRCEREDSKNFPYYGGRGIRVCDRWRDSFDNFLADMGLRPIGYTLERVDNDGPYSPENCRWATRAEQAANTRAARKITYAGMTKTQAEWARVFGVSHQSVSQNVRRHGPVGGLDAIVRKREAAHG